MVALNYHTVTYQYQSNLPLGKMDQSEPRKGP